MGSRWFATFKIFWTIAAIHISKETCKAFTRGVRECLLTKPHLPQYYPQAVDVSFAVVNLGIKYFRCDVNRRSSHRACDVYCRFRYTNVSDLD